MEASLQHVRYSNRLIVDFMHALAEAYEKDGLESEISKKLIFDSVMHTATRGTRAMSVCIFRFDENGSRFVPIESAGLFPFLEGFPPELAGASRIDVLRAHFRGDSYSTSSPVFAAALSAERAMLCDNFPPRRDRVPVPENSPAFPRSVICSPVYSAGKLIGAIVIANPRHGGEFTSSEIKLGDALAQQTATALQMRELFAVQAEKLRLDSELGIAASVQKLLLPHYIPQAHSLDIAATYRPAQKIGGDLYDVFDMGGGRIAAIVADVSGHGVSAALLMAICRTHFQHIAKNSINAADLLRRLNHAMTHSFSRGKFITIVCAFLDTQRNTLSLARGGHERPLVVSNNGKDSDTPKLEFLDSKGLAIGLSNPEVFDATITEVSHPYALGNVLVFYTDGLTEARSPDGEEFGSERLAAAVKRACKKNAAAINDSILAELKAFTQADEFADDLTIVAIKSV